jgi:4'-phosphopantetheinyl transferase
MQLWQDNDGHVYVQYQVLDGGEAARPAAYALLRQLLSDIDGRPPHDWVIEKDDRGKPHVVGADLQISVSHTRGLVAAAVSTGGPLGIDVEAIDRRVPDPLALARRFFSMDEAAALAAIASPEQQRPHFLRLWTAKEAVVKATGHGLAQSLKGFTINLTAPPTVSVTDPDLPSRPSWRLAQWQA